MCPAFPQGEHYAVYPWIGCGACAICDSGDEHLCDRPKQLGITVDGGYASHVTGVRSALPAQHRWALEPKLAGSYMCSGLTAFSALKKIASYYKDGPGDDRRAWRCGHDGFAVRTRALRRRTCWPPTSIRLKREAALEAGASEVFDPADAGARKAVLKATGGVAASVDFVGADSSLNFAHGVVRKGGAVVIAGLLGGKFSIPVPMFPLRALTIMGTYVGSLAEAQEMLELVRAGKVAPIPVELRPLDQANQTLDDLRERKGSRPRCPDALGSVRS